MLVLTGKLALNGCPEGKRSVLHVNVSLNLGLKGFDLGELVLAASSLDGFVDDGLG